MGNKDISKEISKQLQAFVDEQIRNGHIPSMDEMNHHLSLLTNAHNENSEDQFEGFSPEQMYCMVNDPFGEVCPVQLRTLSNEEIEEIPFLKQALHLMLALEQEELKLTARGYIPPKMVIELRDLGLRDWKSLFYKQNTEPMVEVVQVLRMALEECRLIKVRIGKMSLTAKGKKMLNDRNALLHSLMRFMFFNYNSGWLDLHDDMRVANVGRLYSLWLLHRYGDVWRSQSFYAEKYFRAFPAIEPCESYKYRTFVRTFQFIGLCDINDKECDTGIASGQLTRKREILDKVFAFVEPESK